MTSLASLLVGGFLNVLLSLVQDKVNRAGQSSCVQE